MTRIMPGDHEDLDESPAVSWEELLNDLLRGFVHSLNNRVAALSAFTDLATMDASPLDVNSVRAEIDRIYALTSLIGRLAARTDAPEALEVRPLIESAIEMHNHHARSSRHQTGIAQDNPVHPVRVPRSALLRLLLLLVDGCRRKPAATPAIEISGSAEVVKVSFFGCDNVTREMSSLAAVCGATIVTENGNVNLTLPSLPALRGLSKPAQSFS